MKGKMKMKELKQSEVEQLAKDIYQYQLFKIKLGVKKITAKLKPITKYSYVTHGRYYLRNGKDSCIPNKLKKELDEVKNNRKISVIIPLKHQELKSCPRKQHIKTEPINIEVFRKPTELPKDEVKGIRCNFRCNDIIYLIKDENFADAFMKGVEAVGGTAKRVSVIINEE